MVEFNGNVGRTNGGQPQREDSSQEPISAQIAKKILIDFNKKDADQSMRVSFEELSNAIIKEYVANGYQRKDPHVAGETITDLLNYYQERAKEFDVNGDGALNIDEYTAMFREKFEQAKREAEANRKNENMKVQPDSQTAEPKETNHSKSLGEVNSAPQNSEDGSVINPSIPKEENEVPSKFIDIGKKVLGQVSNAVSKISKDITETPTE